MAGSQARVARWVRKGQCVRQCLDRWTRATDTSSHKWIHYPHPHSPSRLSPWQPRPLPPLFLPTPIQPIIRLLTTIGSTSRHLTKSSQHTPNYPNQQKTTSRSALTIIPESPVQPSSRWLPNKASTWRAGTRPSVTRLTARWPSWTPPSTLSSSVSGARRPTATRALPSSTTIAYRCSRRSETGTLSTPSGPSTWRRVSSETPGRTSRPRGTEQPS